MRVNRCESASYEVQRSEGAVCTIFDENCAKRRFPLQNFFKKGLNILIAEIERRDPGEHFDVAAAHPEIVADLNREVEGLIAGRPLFDELLAAPPSKTP